MGRSNGLATCGGIVSKLVFIRPHGVILRLPRNGSVAVYRHPLHTRATRNRQMTLSDDRRMPTNAAYRLAILLLSRGRRGTIQR